MANTAENQAEPVVPERRDPSPENTRQRAIFDLPVTLTVSIGQKRMRVAELLELKPDTVIALTSRIDDPVDLSIEDRLIARGELIEVEDGRLAVKITEVEDASDG